MIIFGLSLVLFTSASKSIIVRVQIFPFRWFMGYSGLLRLSMMGQNKRNLKVNIVMKMPTR